MFDLSALPNEILYTIVDQLVPPLDGLDIPLAAYTNPEGIVVTGRTSLRSLALVSHRISDIAIPALYHTIYLWGNTRLQSLLQTLLEKPHLGRHVRTFSHLSTLGTDFYSCDALSPYTRTHWRLLVELSKLPPRLKAFAREANSNLEIAQVVFAAVLHLTPSLRNLHLRMPFAPGDYALLNSILTPEICDFPTPHVLPSLTRVTLDPMPECPDVHFWPRAELPCLLHLPKLRAVEFGGAAFKHAGPEHNGEDHEGGGDNVADGDWGSVGGWKDVEEVQLARTAVWGPGWNAICAQCPNLRMLEISPQGVPESPAGRLTLNSALDQVADTLESFTFEGVAAASLPEQIGGDDGTLKNLVKMKRLRHLKLDLGALFGKMRRLGAVDVRDRLPSSLEVLDLAELWWDFELDDLYGLGWRRYETNLNALLRTLVVESGKHLPRLKEVVFRPNPASSGFKGLEERLAGSTRVKLTVVY